MSAEKDNHLLKEFSDLVKQLSQDVSVNAIKPELGEALQLFKNNNDLHHSDVKLRLEEVIGHANEIYSGLHGRIADIRVENERVMAAWQTANDHAISMVHDSLQTSESLINKQIDDHARLMHLSTEGLQAANEQFVKESSDFRALLDDSSFQNRMNELKALKESIAVSATTLSETIDANRETANQLRARQNELQSGLNHYAAVFEQLKAFMHQTDRDNQEFRSRAANYHTSMQHEYAERTKALAQQIEGIGASLSQNHAALMSDIADVAKSQDVNTANFIQSFLDSKTAMAEGFAKTSQQQQLTQKETGAISSIVASGIPEIVKKISELEKARETDQLVVRFTLALLVMYVASRFFV